jgi:hypothetical protein
MIEIQNDRGQYLQLYQDTVIENELNSWLLSEDDSLLGSYSVPFRFPIEGNEAFIQHKHRPEAGAFAGIAVSIAIDGLPFGAGLLSFRVVNGAADGFIKIDAGDVAAKLRSKWIHDAVFEESFVLCGTHADLPAAMMRTLDPLTNPYPFVFFPVKNEEFCDPSYEATEYRHQQYINNWGTHLLTPQFTPDTITTIGSPVVPFLYLTYVIKKVCAYLGYTAQGAWLDDPAIKSLVMYNQVAIDCSGLFYSFTVFARWHVWQIKISDFFKLLRDDMGVGIYFDSTRGTVTFRSFVDLATSDATYDFSPDLLTGIQIDPVNEAGVSLKFAHDTSDGYAKEIPAIDNYTIGFGENEVSLQLGTLPMTAERPNVVLVGTAEEPSLAARWMIPIAKQQGVSLDRSYANMGIFNITFPPASSPPKLLSYYGLQPNSNNVNYPFGSSLSRNVKQDRVGTMSLMSDEPDSLFHTYLRPFWEFKVFSKKVIFRFFLRIGIMSRLKLWQKITVGSADMVSLSYLISRITYQLPDIDGRVLAEAVLYPFLPPSVNYVAKIPNGNIWVRIDFLPFESVGLPDSAGSFTVRFSLFTTREAVTVSSSSLPITIFYVYKTRGYESSSDTYPTEEKFESIVVPANSTTVSIDTPLEFWKSDDPDQQNGVADSFYIIRSSFGLLPGGGYRII